MIIALIHRVLVSVPDTLKDEKAQSLLLWHTEYHRRRTCTDTHKSDKGDLYNTKQWKRNTPVSLGKSGRIHTVDDA